MIDYPQALLVLNTPTFTPPTMKMHLPLASDSSSPLALSRYLLTHSLNFIKTKPDLRQLGVIVGPVQRVGLGEQRGEGRRRGRFGRS
jgi:hypothetical protein